MSKPRELLVTRSTRGAFNPDGSLAEDTRRLWGEGDRFPDPLPDKIPCQDVVRVCDEEVTWGGSIVNHYGHFLTETVSRLWPLLPGGELEGLPVVFTTPPMAPFALEWAKAFGFRTVELPERGAVRFTRMFVPEPALRLNAWIAPEIRDIHLHARRGLSVTPFPRNDVLWLSRSGLERERAAYDKVLLEWLLSKHVTIIHPEAVTLADQIGAIEASNAVAGLIGSAFHTMLMVVDPPDCLCLCHGGFASAFEAQDLLLGTNTTFVDALAIAEMMRVRRFESLGGYRILIPEALRAISATLLPILREDPRIEALAYPEHLVSSADHKRWQDELVTTIARMLIDPYSFEARMELGAIFEKENLSRCALEQFTMVAELSDGYTPALLRSARHLARLGQLKAASEMAKQVLVTDPDSKEAASYVTSTSDDGALL